MKQSGAESRGSKTRMLQRLLRKDERDTQLKSRRSFYYASHTHVRLYSAVFSY